MDRNSLIQAIKSKSTYLCVGLDTDINRIPHHLRNAKDPVFEFNKQIIDATVDHCVAYKPNIAFYEALGSSGWESLAKTIAYIPKDIFTIADAKRGDIGNTSKLYAKAFFETMDFDSITVAPYMGEDSVVPFLEFEDKWVILLAHTSNPGSADFQLLEDQHGIPLFEKVLTTSQKWPQSDRLMYVVGATRADKIKRIRQLAPNSFFLVPGVGAQGGDLQAVSAAGLTNDCGLLVNSSRNIIYASAKEDFAREAKNQASLVHEQMKKLLDQYCHV